MRKSNEETTLAKLRVVVHFSQREMADILGITRDKVQNIELGKVELGEELAADIANLFNVNLEWLLDGNTNARILNREGKTYSEKDYIVRQAEIVKRDNFKPEANRELAKITTALAENFGRVAALFIRAAECNQVELLDYRLRSAMRKIYEESGRKPERTWKELPFLAAYGGKATITRPDVSVMLAEWEIRFKKLVAKQTDDKLPATFKSESLPDIHPPRKPAKPTRR